MGEVGRREQRKVSRGRGQPRGMNMGVGGSERNSSCLECRTEPCGGKGPGLTRRSWGAARVAWTAYSGSEGAMGVAYIHLVERFSSCRGEGGLRPTARHAGLPGCVAGAAPFQEAVWPVGYEWCVDIYR